MIYYKVHAPPGRIWSDWYDLSAVTGKRSIELEFGTESQAPSSFDAQIKYWDGNTQKLDNVVCPGKIVIKPRAYCVPKVRCRSHSLGQVVTITEYLVHI